MVSPVNPVKNGVHKLPTSGMNPLGAWANVGVRMFRMEFGVSEAAFRTMVILGEKILIVCSDEVTPVRGSFHGGWHLYAFNPDSGNWAQLTLFRPKGGQNPPRVLRTVNGVCSVMKDLGFPAGIIPFGVGSGVEASRSGSVLVHDSVELLWTRPGARGWSGSRT